MPKMVLKDFWAPWCQPCRQMAPVLDQLQQEFPDLVIEKINIDTDEIKTANYGVMSLPTFVIEKDDKEVKRFVGVIPKEDLVKALRD